MAKVTELRQFAGKPIPRGVTHWTIRRSDGSTCRVRAPDGAEHEQFAIESSAGNPSPIVGAGDFELGWLIEEEGVRRPVGPAAPSRSPARRPEPAPEFRAPAPPTVPASPQAMGRSGIPAEPRRVRSWRTSSRWPPRSSGRPYDGRNDDGHRRARAGAIARPSRRRSPAAAQTAPHALPRRDDEEDDERRRTTPTSPDGRRRLVDWAKEKGVLELAKVVDGFGAEDAGKLVAFFSPTSRS